ncbi:MAG: hypothetical protein AAFX85_14630 [Pseudomonadota bacterium]
MASTTPGTLNWQVVQTYRGIDPDFMRPGVSAYAFIIDTDANGESMRLWFRDCGELDHHSPYVLEGNSGGRFRLKPPATVPDPTAEYPYLGVVVDGVKLRGAFFYLGTGNDQGGGWD